MFNFYLICILKLGFFDSGVFSSSKATGMITKSFFNRLLPSFRINEDVEFPLAGERYRPVPINRLRVTPLVKKYILKSRESSASLKLESNRRLSIIIPYRDRQCHLDKLIPSLVPLLKEQNINFKILVVEQTIEKSFNRGKLKNVGAHFLRNSTDYYCFHDVDQLPIVADYRCPSSPLRLLTTFENTWRKGNLIKGVNFGGVVSLKVDDFYAANGYSNEYWRWGKEDDDLFIRLIFSELTPFFDANGQFRELPNPPGQNRDDKAVIKRNKKRKSRLLRMIDDYFDDGINNLAYDVCSYEEYNGYKKLVVDI